MRALTLVLTILVAATAVADDLYELRLHKARLIVEDHYAGNGMYAWLGTLIQEHASHGDEKFSSYWWWSLVYGGANFSLRVGAAAPGLCSGPLDVKSTTWSHHRRMRDDTAAHIKHHVDESYLGYRKGYRGIRNCHYVFLPSNPRDWGGGRFRRTHEIHRKTIREAYVRGELP